MDADSFLQQFHTMELEQQLHTLQFLPSGITLETVISAIFDLSVSRQRQIFESIPMEVQKSWVQVLTSEQKQILLQRATTRKSKPTQEVKSPQPRTSVAGDAENSHVGSKRSVDEEQGFVESIITIMRISGPLDKSPGLLPIADVIHNHIFSWLQRVLVCAVEHENVFQYLASLYSFSLAPFLRWQEMNKARKSKVSKVPSLDQIELEEIWVPEASIFLGHKHRLLKQSKLTEKMSYSDYASYCREREESFLRSQGKNTQQVFKAALIKLCPAIGNLLTVDVIQLLAYLAKDRTGAITEIMVAKQLVSPEGALSAIEIITQLFPEPIVQTSPKKRRREQQTLDEHQSSLD